MSAILPNGTRKTAEDKIYDVATQLKSSASIENSWPIEGNATFIEEDINGTKKAPIVEIISAIRLLSIITFSSFNYNIFSVNRQPAYNPIQSLLKNPYMRHPFHRAMPSRVRDCYMPLRFYYRIQAPC
jgi:hypothetical protein